MSTLEIVRGRPWSVVHTVQDTEDGPLTNLAEFVSFQSQIREKTATRNTKGFFEHALVTNVTVTADFSNSTLTLSLTRDQVDQLKTGEYLIDMIGLYTFSPTGSYEQLLPPEPAVVVNFPTQII